MDMIIPLKIVKHGVQSLYLRIPADIARANSLRAGDSLVLEKCRIIREEPEATDEANPG